MSLVHDPEKNVYHFETEELKGFIDPEGQRHGVKKLVHKPTGLQVVHPKYDLLNLFLLFSTNHYMGTAREKERTVEAAGDTLELQWAPTDDHRAELTARYRIVEPNLIDLDVTVRSDWPYPAYEVFLSNYFDLSMRPYVYVQGSPFDDPPDQPRWIAPEVNDVFVGSGLVFPRDQHAARRSVDGRWDRIWALYQWNPQRYYELPITMQADIERGIAAVLMSRPEHCYAVISGYESGNLNDPFKDQNPLYLSLFGDDLRPGDERTVRARIAVTELDAAMSQPSALYTDFIAK